MLNRIVPRREFVQRPWSTIISGISSRPTCTWCWDIEYVFVSGRCRVRSSPFPKSMVVHSKIVWTFCVGISNIIRTSSCLALSLWNSTRLPMLLLSTLNVSFLILLPSTTMTRVDILGHWTWPASVSSGIASSRNPLNMSKRVHLNEKVLPAPFDEMQDYRGGYVPPQLD